MDGGPQPADGVKLVDGIGDPLAVVGVVGGFVDSDGNPEGDRVGEHQRVGPTDDKVAKPHPVRLAGGEDGHLGGALLVPDMLVEVFSVTDSLAEVAAVGAPQGFVINKDGGGDGFGTILHGSGPKEPNMFA